MAVSSRKVQNKRDSNGVLTGKAGTVYDVNIKYTGQDGKKKSYAKKGFATKKEATQPILFTARSLLHKASRPSKSIWRNG